MIKRLAILALVTLLLPALAVAEESSDTGEEPWILQKPIVQALKTSEKTRDYISRNLTLLTKKIDLFFSNKEDIEDENDTYFRWSHILTHDFHRNYLYQNTFTAHLDLPNINKRLSLIIQSSEDEEEKTNINQPLKEIADEQKNKPVTASIQYVFREVKKWRYTASLGYALPDDPFVRLRARRKFTTGDWKSRAAQSVTWHFDDSWETQTSLEAKNILDEKSLAQTNTVISWSDDEPDLVILEEDLSLYYSISKRTIFQFKVGTTCVSQPNLRTIQYRFSPIWRKDIHEGWLFLSGGPQFQIDREEEWTANHSVFIALDIIFAEDREIN